MASNLEESEMTEKVAKKKIKIQKAVSKNTKKRTKKPSVKRGKKSRAKKNGMTDVMGKDPARRDLKARTKILSRTLKG